MSEEFKKEEINGEAAEETKAAEHTEEVKAETTAEQSAAETEKPQETAEAPKAEEKKTTTYSWVNPKISGKTGRSFINVSFINISSLIYAVLFRYGLFYNTFCHFSTVFLFKPSIFLQFLRSAHQKASLL